ncbi:MAG: tRNA (5-methylaminomethyl-2-thiouridine)(34)-methyltransferase MnmD, partial [Betaproteobacteria bacterium]|nr:tRNA (5-methylaminomethyl-2-thiouridine)(34)-methyltransferase MnmD [Betaproteobacteria bacterium]
MSRTISLPAAEVSSDADGTPYSPAYGDVYHSAGGATAQARHVFLAGNSLPQRWRGRARFTILETGFGLGLNFLEAWRTLDDDPDAPRALHFVSVEKHPASRATLAALHARWPEHAARSRELLAAWPLPIAGFHRLHFAGGRVVLTLLLGDAGSLLPQLEAGVDAFFLDGFAPDRNPQLWSRAIFAELARLAASDATLATWSAAAVVREGLAAAGFAVARRPGFGGKRDMLAGHR